MESRELAIRLARALDAKKAFNIHILEVEDLTTVTEYFVIATGNSTTTELHSRIMTGPGYNFFAFNFKTALIKSVSFLAI